MNSPLHKGFLKDWHSERELPKTELNRGVRKMRSPLKRRKNMTLSMENPTLGNLLVVA